METPAHTRRLTDLPPRNIDWFTQATILFGGFMQQFGWLFFGFGMIFFWAFFWNSTARFWFTDFGRWEETSGFIILSESTNASVNDRIVRKYIFQFETEGKKYTGKAFDTGGGFGMGDEVTVRYRPSNPKNAYIKGMRRAIFPAFTAFVLIFPLAGLAFIFFNFRQNLKFLDVLKIGEFTRGCVVSKKPTGSEIIINKVRYPVYKYEFEFSYKDKNYLATCQTHQTQFVEDEEREIILFDRFNPDYNIVYDAMPNAPAINEAGFLEPSPPKSAWVLLMPAFSILAHGWYAWYVS